MTTAKLFWNGNSQAVRLPKEFRFSGSLVRIRKQGRQVIIEPIDTDWAWLDDLGEPDPSWAEAVENSRDALPQARDWDFL